MNLLNFVKKESSVSLQSLMALTLISGIAQGVLLAIINAAAADAAYAELNFRYLLMFGIAIAIFIVAKRVALARSFVVAEEVIAKLRIRIVDKLRRSNLAVAERIGKAHVEARLAQDTQTISLAAGEVVNAIQSAVMIAVCVLYLAFLSKVAFVITLGMIVGGVSIYLRNQRSINRELQAATEKETEFYASLGHMMDGFKELKVNQGKSEDIFQNHFARICLDAQQVKVRTGLEYVRNFIFSQTFFYILIAVLVFLLPSLSASYADVIVKATAVILFIVGPLTALVSSIPTYARANVAIGNIAALDQFLDSAEASGERQVEPAKIDFRGFQEIAVDAVGFTYFSEAGAGQAFAVGPFNLAVKAGEVVFIVGGNGSGKSTFLKLLTGLYAPQQGTLKVDGLRLQPAHYPAYRELYSVIFTDFHLFDRLYGLSEVDEKRVAQLLQRMQLDDKTSFQGGRFTNLNLSTGQKKRLALLIACLEDRPVLALDEFAADQDPEFRRFFYETLVPELKAAGKTVIAVTHDDRYFSCADRVIKLEYGQVESIR
ncbi:MAG TPA: cyclic peptide export ABC transporter [Opitutaceae bacterium]